MFSALALQKIVFSRVWGAMAPKASLVTCLGRLGHQNRPKNVPQRSFAVPFGVLVRRSRFLCFLYGFLQGPTLDPLAGAIETQFFILGVASKRVSFLQQLLKHSGYIWRRNPLKKALQNRAWTQEL